MTESETSVRSLQEGDQCPQAGCRWAIVWCDCDDAVEEYGERGHLICRGCGQDADRDLPNPSNPCDCGPEDQPAEDEGR